MLRTTQVLVTSRELPFQRHLVKLGEFACPTSWNPSQGRGHVYVRGDLVRAPPALLRRFCSHDGVCWLPFGYTHHVPTAAQEPLEGYNILPNLVLPRQEWQQQ